LKLDMGVQEDQSMKTCPYCAESIQDEAIKCRYCGEFLDGRRSTPSRITWFPGRYWGYEYRSEIQFLGWPLLHIAQGPNPETGLPRVARGIIAIGDFAIGLVAIGGFALGGFVLGGIGLGLFALGGIVLGGVALGGISLALWLAVGGIAVSIQYAIGGIALARHTLSSFGADPELLRWWQNLWSSIYQ
jgi:hypothetical protein